MGFLFCDFYLVFNCFLKAILSSFALLAALTRDRGEERMCGHFCSFGITVVDFLNKFHDGLSKRAFFIFKIYVD